MLISVLLLLLTQAPEDPARIVEGLRSEKQEERVRTELKLKQLGRKAVPALEQAAKDGDPEVAGRARRLLRVLPVMEKLTPNLIREIPGLEERLAFGEPHAWTDALLQAADRDDDGRRKLPKLQRSDLDALVPQAFQAMREEDLTNLCGIVREESLRSAVPGLVNLLRQGKGYILAQDALAFLDAAEAVPDLVALLRSPDESARWNALWGLIRMDAAATAPDVRKLLQDGAEYVRRDAARALGQFGAKEALADLRAALRDEDGDVRCAAAGALGMLESKEAVPDLLKLLKADYNHLRSAAATALGGLGATEARGQIQELVRDLDPGVRACALEALAELGGKESVADLRALLKDEALCGAAGRALVRLGSREGVPAVLDAAERGGDFLGLFVLNALRRPELWAGLRMKRLRRDLRGIPKEAGAAWAREAGIAPDELRGDEPMILRSYRGRTTLRDALWEMSMSGNNHLVFESDRIRNLRQAEALKFWKEWWALEQKK